MRLHWGTVPRPVWRNGFQVVAPRPPPPSRDRPNLHRRRRPSSLLDGPTPVKVPMMMLAPWILHSTAYLRPPAAPLPCFGMEWVGVCGDDDGVVSIKPKTLEKSPHSYLLHAASADYGLWTQCSLMVMMVQKNLRKGACVFFSDRRNYSTRLTCLYGVMWGTMGSRNLTETGMF